MAGQPPGRGPSRQVGRFVSLRRGDPRVGAGARLLRQVGLLRSVATPRARWTAARARRAFRRGRRAVPSAWDGDMGARVLLGGPQSFRAVLR